MRGSIPELAVLVVAILIFAAALLSTVYLSSQIYVQSQRALALSEIHAQLIPRPVSEDRVRLHLKNVGRWDCVVREAWLLDDRGLVIREKSVNVTLRPGENVTISDDVKNDTRYVAVRMCLQQSPYLCKILRFRIEYERISLAALGSAAGNATAVGTRALGPVVNVTCYPTPIPVNENASCTIAWSGVDVRDLPISVQWTPKIVSDTIVYLYVYVYNRTGDKIYARSWGSELDESLDEYCSCFLNSSCAYVVPSGGDMTFNTSSGRWDFDLKVKRACGRLTVTTSTSVLKMVCGERKDDVAIVIVYMEHTFPGWRIYVNGSEVRGEHKVVLRDGNVVDVVAKYIVCSGTCHYCDEARYEIGYEIVLRNERGVLRLVREWRDERVSVRKQVSDESIRIDLSRDTIAKVFYEVSRVTVSATIDIKFK